MKPAHSQRLQSVSHFGICVCFFYRLLSINEHYLFLSQTKKKMKRFLIDAKKREKLLQKLNLTFWSVHLWGWLLDFTCTSYSKHVRSLLWHASIFLFSLCNNIFDDAEQYPKNSVVIRFFVQLKLVWCTFLINSALWQIFPHSSRNLIALNQLNSLY